MTTGLMTGAAIRKVTAAAGGTPFRTRLRNTGTEAQSHTGRQKPAKAANKRLPARCFGKCSWSHCCETNIWMAEDRSTPIRRNGNACNRIPRNTLTTASAKFPPAPITMRRVRYAAVK